MTAEEETEPRTKGSLAIAISYAVAVFGLFLVIIPAIMILVEGISNLPDVPIIFTVLFLVGAGLALIGLTVIIIILAVRTSKKKPKKAPKVKEVTEEEEEEIIEETLEEAVEDALEDTIEEVVDEDVDEEVIEEIAEDIAEEVIEISEEEDEVVV